MLLAGLAMAFGSSALLLGATGQVYGRMQVFHAMGYATPELREVMMKRGFEEARASFLLGSWTGLPLLGLGAVAMRLALRRGAPR